VARPLRVVSLGRHLRRGASGRPARRGGEPARFGLPRFGLPGFGLPGFGLPRYGQSRCGLAGFGLLGFCVHLVALFVRYPD
jgi:hypothetical protein